MVTPISSRLTTTTPCQWNDSSSLNPEIRLKIRGFLNVSMVSSLHTHTKLKTRQPNITSTQLPTLCCPNLEWNFCSSSARPNPNQWTKLRVTWLGAWHEQNVESKVTTDSQAATDLRSILAASSLSYFWTKFTLIIRLTAHIKTAAHTIIGVFSVHVYVGQFGIRDANWRYFDVSLMLLLWGRLSVAEKTRIMLSYSLKNSPFALLWLLNLTPSTGPKTIA